MKEKTWTDSVKELCIQYELDFKQLQKTYLTFLVLGLIYVFPIILDNRFYVDDLARSIEGYTRWGGSGRPFADWIMALLNFQYPFDANAHIIDISPMPQILAICVLALGAAVLCCKLFKEKTDFYAILVCFPFIASPFFIQCLSFKFDAFPLSIALTIPVIAALNFKDRTIGFILGSSFILIGLSIYQASVNVFIATSLLLFLSEFHNDPKKSLFLLLDNMGKFLAGIFLYKFIILKRFLNNNDGYVEAHSEQVSFDLEGLMLIKQNIIKFNDVLFHSFLDTPLLVCLALLSIILFLVKFSFQANGLLNKFINLIVVSFVSIVLFFASYGILVFLENPVTNQARVYMGLSIFLVFILYCFQATVGTWKKRSQILLVIPIFYFFFLAYGYAAAAKDQTRFEQYLTEQVIHKLKDHNFSSENTLIFDGTILRSPILRNSCSNRIICNLVVPAIRSQWKWGYKYIAYFDFNYRRQARKPASYFCSNKPLEADQHYKIFKKEETFVVAFPNGKCFKRWH